MIMIACPTRAGISFHIPPAITSGAPQLTEVIHLRKPARQNAMSVAKTKGKTAEDFQEDIATLPQDSVQVRTFLESSASTAPCLLVPLGLVGASAMKRLGRNMAVESSAAGQMAGRAAQPGIGEVGIPNGPTAWRL